LEITMADFCFDHLKNMPAEGNLVLAPGIELAITADRDDFDMLALLDRVVGIFDRESHVHTIVQAVEKCLKADDADGLDDLIMALGWIDNDNTRGPDGVAAAILALLPIATTWWLFVGAETADLILREAHRRVDDEAAS
jgi:hypothetical protein